VACVAAKDHGISGAKGRNGRPAFDAMCKAAYWRKTHFGGRYLIFLCSECRRAARVLYARNTDRIWFFSCRKCQRICGQWQAR
jgi:hypothetical protein